MNTKDFNNLVVKTQEQCIKVLHEKEKQYATNDDRLIQFKRAATLQEMSHIEALGGMMVKHTTKLYMMIADWANPSNDWDEVITDHINYLYLLKGVLEDSKGRK